MLPMYNVMLMSMYNVMLMSMICSLLMCNVSRLLGYGMRVMLECGWDKGGKKSA